MLLVIGALLAAFWVLGVATSYTFGGLIHVLLILALLALVSRIAEGPVTRWRPR